MQGKFISRELFADLKPINVFHTEYPQVMVPNATEKYADKHLNRRQLLHTDMAETDMIFQLHSLVFEKSL